jgi:hypothetical protein
VRAHERCRETVFGPEQERVLVCIDMTPVAIDLELGIVGPAEHRYDLEVVATQGKRRVELLRLPFAFGMASTDLSTTSELLFGARYAIDAAAGTLDMELSPTECAAALAMLEPYWRAQSAELRAGSNRSRAFREQLARANDRERRSDAERISATCRSAGRYTRTRDGRMRKVGK